MHYNAAILALASLQSPAQCGPWSPNSTSSSALPSLYSRRRSSVYSDRSAASSVTSLGDDDDDDYQQMSLKYSRESSATQGSEETTFQTKLQSSMSRPQTPQQFYFSANIDSFVRMIEGHLADVREQRHRTSVPIVRFTMPSPRLSPTKATRSSWSISVHIVVTDQEAAMDATCDRMRNIKLRPCFNHSIL